jgi:hypothetical protein
MTNIFDSISFPNLKDIYNQAIDALLKDTALTLPCRLRYSGQQNQNFCNNCIYDPISKLSSSIYNGSGPNPFSDGGVCPVCLGNGITDSEKAISSTIVHLAVLFDSKYFLNINKNQILNIPAGSIQTICSINLITQLRNANDMVVDTNTEPYGGYLYERNGDPEPAGFGNSRYIITMWKRK